MYFLGKSSPTTPTSLTGAKKLAATDAWLAEPPSSRGFSAFGVLIESSAVEPTINTLMQFQSRCSGFQIKLWMLRGYPSADKSALGGVDAPNSRCYCRKNYGHDSTTAHFPPRHPRRPPCHRPHAR